MAPFAVRKGLLITTIHLNLTTPCPDPGAGLPPPRGTEVIKVFFQVGVLRHICTPLSALG